MLNARSYLFGTIHVAYTEVWDYVSDKVKEAFDEADSIVFELKLHDPETIETLMRCKNLEDGMRIRDILPFDIYMKLKLYMKQFRQNLYQWSYKKHSNSKSNAKKHARHLYSSLVGDWETKKPVWLLFLLYQISETFTMEKRDSAPMFDVFLAHKALNQGKRIHSIESPEEQCNPLTSVNDEQIVFAINYTLSYLDFISRVREARNQNGIENESISQTSMEDLIRRYRCGDLEESIFTMKKFAHSGFSVNPEIDVIAHQIDRQIVDDIIVKRNIRMASRIQGLLQSRPSTSFFFALGTGHYLGEESIINLLEENGYFVSPVTDDEEILGYLRAAEARGTKFNELWIRDVPEDKLQISISMLEMSNSSCSNFVFSIYLLIFLLMVIFYS
uniref:Metalloprotease TIKI homolog n=1 Tax=Acrobeloides nanus TaxID=290746 RepID=A0A914EQT7_9BILA